jgi:hypothetical protein
MQDLLIIGGISICGGVIGYLFSLQWCKATGYMRDEEGHLDPSANSFLIKMWLVLGLAPIVVEALIKVGFFRTGIC